MRMNFFFLEGSNISFEKDFTAHKALYQASYIKAAFDSCLTSRLLNMQPIGSLHKHAYLV